MGNTICGARDRHLIIHPTESFRKIEESDSDSSDLQKFDSNSPLTTILQLSVKCTNLQSEDRFQLLSPMAQITIKSSFSTPKPFQTEVQSNTLTPIFTKTLKLPFNLSSTSEIYIEIFDLSKKTKTFIGSNTFSVHELTPRVDFVTKELLFNEKRKGNILLSIKELKDFTSIVTMKWSFDPKVPLKNRYFLRISKTTAAEPVPVYQTETRESPSVWEQFQVTLSKLCKANTSQKVLAEIVELSANLPVIGNCFFTVSQLSIRKSFQVTSAETTVGSLLLESFTNTSKFSFLDYIQSGVEICPFYVIDFSETLGHSEDLEQNLYLNCIKTLQQNLQYYSQDPLYTVLGTGAVFAGTTKPSFCFALNGNIFQPEVASHSNLMTYYQTTHENIKQAGKTCFAEVLDLCVKYIQNELIDSHKYYVMFIISAGDPSDIDDVVGKFQIVNELPLSVFVLTVNNDLFGYENLEKAKNMTKRTLFEQFESKDVMQALVKLEEHIMKYAEYKEIENFKKHEKIRVRSNSLKMSPEKIRVRSNYFTKAKAEYIDYLNSIEYPNDKIEEVSQIGVPYVLFDIDEEVKLPVRARAKKMTVKQKSLKSADLTCLNCAKVVEKFAELPCGCRYFCSECVGFRHCPSC